MFRPFHSAPLIVAMLGSIACGKAAERAPRPNPSADASVKPLDRLAPGELRPGAKQVFGLEVPEGIVVQLETNDAAYLQGSASPDALANYVRDRVVVDHVEIGAARTVFPYARIKKGPADRFFQIEVIAGKGRTELVVKDVTPRPTLPPEQISDQERWRRAGRRPDGKPLDISEFK